MHASHLRIASDLWEFLEAHFQFKESARFLAHYTSAAAAIQILQTGELWARDTATVDPRHVEGHRQLFAAQAVSMYREAGPKPHALFRKSLAEQFVNPVLAPTFFAACLSSATDSSHMWRKYGNNGDGVAIVVDTQWVNRDLKVMAVPCMYELAAQRTLFADLMERCDALAESLPHEKMMGELVPPATALANMLLQAYKHPYLTDEHECRYVYMENDEQPYPRLNAPHPTRRSFPLVGMESPSPFVSVVSGPRRTHAMDAALRNQLSTAGYSDIPITRSLIVDIAN